MFINNLLKKVPTVFLVVNNKAFTGIGFCFIGSTGRQGYYINPEPEDWGFDEEDKKEISKIIDYTRSKDLEDCLRKFVEYLSKR